MNPEDYPVFPAVFFTGLVTARFFETWDFYTAQLGFRTVEERGAWVRLLHPGGAQLVLLQEEADETPAELVSATDGRGLWLTLEVADPATERMALTAAGVAVHVVPQRRWWRPGTFAVRDPNGVMIMVTPRPSLVTRIVAAESAA